ncbi:MAG: NAD(+)/NADH kinase [Armatimonadaceae bacterium]
MHSVGLLINEGKPAALDSARRLIHAYADRSDICLLARDTVARSLSANLCHAATDTEIAQTDFVVVFGGDGTLLAAARLVAPYETPILGIHLGQFGFITEVAPERLMTAVDAALSGACQIEERLMLQGEIERGSDPPEGTIVPEEPLLAVNDIVVASGMVRMVHVQTRIGEHLLATYAADGVIVSSPTGSTGYSLSAGGPLVHPAAPVLLVTPVSPHTLNARALLVPDTETVHLTVEGKTRDSVLASVDGQLDIPLHPGDTVHIRRAPFNARLLTVGGPNFYQKIRSRWHYGERTAP